jgi:hypothetical protein
MKLAILFWFYKNPQICKNRLEILRKYNPNTPIYGLYGGNLNQQEHFYVALGQYLDDFYTFDRDRDSFWKWKYGDLLITDWYRERGQHLSWDSIIVVQWDMLIFGSVDRVFDALKQNQILLSAYAPVKTVEDKWIWVNSPENRQEYLEFLAHIRHKYDYNQEPVRCAFVIVCLPRTFLAFYSKIEQPELGFIEYRVPIYAQIFQIDVCRNHPFKYWGAAKKPIEKVLRAGKKNDPGIPLTIVLRNLINLKGARVFHPYYEIFPVNIFQGFWLLSKKLKEFLKKVKSTKLKKTVT